MGTPFRYIQGVALLRCQDRTIPLPEGRRVRPQVEGHVEDRARGASDQFGLGKWCRLVVHAPQGTPATIEGNAALTQSGIQTVPFKLLLAPRTGEESPLVPQSLGINLNNTWDIRPIEDHAADSNGFL